MEIQYLKTLQENPIKYGKTINFPIEGVSENEISQLEQKYNNGNPFPKALRELLFLAGKDCYVLDTGRNETPEELQQYVRKKLNKDNLSINKPFYAIDVYNALDQCLVVFFDEGDDPYVYEVFYDYESYGDEVQFIDKIGKTLSKFIESRVKDVKMGFNPF